MAVREQERPRADRLGVVPRRGSELRYRTVHGYRRAFRVAGRGEPVVLLHGIGDSSATREAVLPALARGNLVVAPDLLGHGHPDKPRADYSVAAHANGVRDLLGVLGIGRVTLVGHSLGGGVAMQFAHRFPDRVERLVLVGSGGAGTEVSPLLRAASVPGAQLALTTLRLPGMRAQVGLPATDARAAGHGRRTGLPRDAPGRRRAPGRDGQVGVPAHAARRRGLAGTGRVHAGPLLPDPRHADAAALGRRDAVVPVAHARRAQWRQLLRSPRSEPAVADGAERSAT